MPYETESTYTLKEQMEYSKAFFFRKRKLFLLLAIILEIIMILRVYHYRYIFPFLKLSFSVASVIPGFSLMIFFLVLAVVFPFLLVLSFNIGIRRGYEANKISHNVVSKYLFYEDHFEKNSEYSILNLTYDKLYSIVETKTHFYLLINASQACIIIKDNCSPELITFLQDIKRKVNKK